MNALTLFHQTTACTMTTRDIAALTGKAHAHVMRDMRRIFQANEINTGEYIQNWISPQNNQTYPEFVLTKKWVLVLVTGYSDLLRTKVIERLEQLESQQPRELSRLEILQIALAAEQEKEALQKRLATVEPCAMAFVELTNSDGVFTLREAAKAIHWGPKKFKELLLKRGWIFRNQSQRLEGYSTHIDKGYLKHVAHLPRERSNGEKVVYQSVRVTAHGLARLAQIIEKEGLV